MKKTLKRISSLLVTLCFFLPLSQCQSPQVPNSELTLEQIKTQKENEEKNNNYSFKMSDSFNKMEFKSWLVLLLFLWPFIFVTIQELMEPNKVKLLILTSPILCGVTIYGIGQLFLFTKLLYGGYIWVIAITTYTIITFLEFVQFVKKKI